MTEEDKLAIATLAASRCAALGQHKPTAYVVAYAEIEQLFREYREAEADERAAATLKTWRQL